MLNIVLLFLQERVQKFNARAERFVTTLPVKRVVCVRLTSATTASTRDECAQPTASRTTTCATSWRRIVARGGRFRLTTWADADVSEAYSSVVLFASFTSFTSYLLMLQIRAIECTAWPARTV